MTNVEDADLREAAETFPLFANVFFVADDDDVFQLVFFKVAGSERHDEIAQSYQRRMSVGKETDDDVVAEDGHSRLLSGLQPQHMIQCGH